MQINWPEVISILLLIIPTVWECIEDRKGDVHPNNDWIIRGGLMVIAAFLSSLIVHRGFFAALAFSFGFFSLVFPYAINIIHGQEKWWSHLSKTAIPDKWPMWAGIPWFGRLLVLLIVFGTCFSIYFWDEMQIWNYPYGH